LTSESDAAAAVVPIGVVAPEAAEEDLLFRMGADQHKLHLALKKLEYLQEQAELAEERVELLEERLAESTDAYLAKVSGFVMMDGEDGVPSAAEVADGDVGGGLSGANVGERATSWQPRNNKRGREN
jgi:hypothetical protein